MAKDIIPEMELRWNVQGSRIKGNSIEQQLDGVRKSIASKGLIEDDAQDRELWRNMSFKLKGNYRTEYVSSKAIN